MSLGSNIDLTAIVEYIWFVRRGLGCERYCLLIGVYTVFSILDVRGRSLGYIRAA